MFAGDIVGERDELPGGEIKTLQTRHTEIEVADAGREFTGSFEAGAHHGQAVFSASPARSTKMAASEGWPSIGGVTRISTPVWML